MEGIIKFAIWFFLIMILAAFILMGLQIFGFFMPMECLHSQTETLSKFIQKAIEIPEGEERIEKWKLWCVENVTKKDGEICIYTETDYRCLESKVNILFPYEKEEVKTLTPATYLVTISKFNVIIER